MAWLDVTVARTVWRSLAISCLAPCAIAAAHGEPPKAYSVLVADENGPVVVKLGAGFARRRSAGRFQFICPAAWGDESGAPAAALDDGTLVIGAHEGLMLLSPDGALRAHPDANARGFSTELVQNHGGVFSLRLAQGRSEVLAIDAQTVHSLWSDSRSWYSMAALPDALVLVRASGTSVEQLSLALSGTEIDRQQATVSAPVDYVFARSAGDEPYALLLFQAGPELGRITDGVFTRSARGASSIAGPLADADQVLLAIDGQLSVLRAGAPEPLADDGYVTCLETTAEQSFACTRAGVARLNQGSVGETVFSLSSLIAPDSSAIDDESARGRCEYQWQDLRFDLIAIGMPLTYEGPDSSEAAADGSADQKPQDGTGDAGSVVDADGDDAEIEPTEGSSGCALGSVRAAGALRYGMLLLAFGALMRRRRVRTRTPSDPRCSD